VTLVPHFGQVGILFTHSAFDSYLNSTVFKAFTHDIINEFSHRQDSWMIASFFGQLRVFAEGEPAF